MARRGYILRNYLSLAGVFLAFAVVVGVYSAFTNDEAAAYLIGVAFIGVAAFLERGAGARLSRGFAFFAFIFLAFTAAFPLSDIMAPNFPDRLLYLSFVGMLVLLAILLWRIATHKEPNEEVG